MYIANIQYVDLESGKKKTLTAYFHMNKLALARFAYKNPTEAGTLARIVKANDEKMKKNENPTFEEIENAFAALCAAAYGTRVGNKFVSNPEAGMAFINSEAYCEMAGDMFLDLKKLAEFAKSVAPGQDYSVIDQELDKLYGGEDNV